MRFSYFDWFCWPWEGRVQRDYCQVAELNSILQSLTAQIGARAKKRGHHALLGRFFFFWFSLEFARRQNAEKALRTGTLSMQAALEWWPRNATDSTHTCDNFLVLGNVTMVNPRNNAIIFLENFAAMSARTQKNTNLNCIRIPVPHTFERDKYRFIKFTIFICTDVCSKLLGRFEVPGSLVLAPHLISHYLSQTVFTDVLGPSKRNGLTFGDQAVT